MRIAASIFALITLLVSLPAYSGSTDPQTSPPAIANDADIVPPVIVQLENVHVDHGMKVVAMGNSNNHYTIYCNIEASGCITPEPDRNYLLIDKRTHWKMPGATGFISLSFVQDWTVKYNKGENIALVDKEDPSPDKLGMYVLDENPGYDRGVISTDGPIIYGTGLSNEDRAKAWKHFFLQMVEACDHQQGQDVLSLKLAKRCEPGAQYCTMAIDANLIGVGGIQEPRKVLLVVLTDPKDSTKQLARTVCTYPSKDVRVCREWDTGKLVDYSDKSP